MAGLYGKVPAHGDFVRRGLPTSFVGPWDAWLAAGIAAARDRLGAHWEGSWDSAPAWRFALPPGACGPDAVAGVMLPSQDQVGRRFPITLAALLPPGAAPPEADWFDALEGAALAGRAGHADADALSAAVPMPGAPVLAPAFVIPAATAAGAPATRHETDDAWGVAAGPLAGTDPLGEGDVLAMFAAAPDAAAPRGMAEDPLALLIGGAGAPDQPHDAIDPDGTLAGLIGEPLPTPRESAGAAQSSCADLPDAQARQSAQVGHWPRASPAGLASSLPAADDGTLAGLIGAATDDPPLLLTGGGDDVLAGLIGAAAADSVPPGAFADKHESQPDSDVLAGLTGVIAGGSAGPGGSVDGHEAPSGSDVLAGLIGGGAGAAVVPDASAGDDHAQHDTDGLPGLMAAGPAQLTIPEARHEPSSQDGTAAPLAETHGDAIIPAAAPPAPSGGGWWTRGAAHVPPMVWPLPGLPDPTDFAYLLEAAE